MTQLTEPIIETAELLPEGVPLYANGFGFQALSVFAVRMAGITLVDFQLFGGLLLATWLLVPTWLLFRELLDHAPGATLATAIVFLNSEFLFVILRGTHEKFTRGLIVLALYLLIKGLRERASIVRFSAYVLAFYLLLYATTAFNNYFASSFLFTTLIALLGYLFARARTGEIDSESTFAIRRLTYVLLASTVIIFIYTFYLYEPARRSVLSTSTILENVYGFLFNYREPDVTRSYGYIDAAWINRSAYLALSAPNLLLLITSAMVWFYEGWTLMRRHKVRLRSEVSPLWIFYGAFAVLGLVSIAIDLSGSVVGNAQNRAVQFIVTLGAPLVVRQALRWNLRLTRIRLAAVAGVAMLFAILSISKASNEPLLTSQWTFYNPGERKAVTWKKRHAPAASASLWIGYDGRILNAFVNRGENTSGLDIKEVDPVTRDTLFSNVIAERGLRLSRPAPLRYDDLVIYDNGQGQIRHRRPATPFQR